MKILSLIAVSLFFIFGAQCQNRHFVTESKYDFELKGAAPASLSSVLDSTFVINARLKVFRDSRYCLLFLEETSISNKNLANNGENEEGRDSIFFDLKNRLMYSIREHKMYPYFERAYPVVETGKEIIQVRRGDTLITLLKSLDKFTSPSPLISAMPYGIKFYSGKNYSFKNTSSAEVEMNLDKIYEKVKSFGQGTGPLPFVY